MDETSATQVAQPTCGWPAMCAARLAVPAGGIGVSGPCEARRNHSMLEHRRLLTGTLKTWKRAAGE